MTPVNLVVRQKDTTGGIGLGGGGRERIRGEVTALSQLFIGGKCEFTSHEILANAVHCQ